MKSKIIIVVVTVVSLLTCLCVPTFAAEVTTTESSDVVLDWSYSYATGFSNGVASPVSTGSSIYGGLIIGNPYATVWLWTSHTTFNASTGTLTYAISSQQGSTQAVVYFVFKGVEIVSKPSSATVVSYEEFASNASISLPASGAVSLRTGYSSTYSVPDAESALSDCTIVRCSVITNTNGVAENITFVVNPMVPPRYVSYDGFLDFVSVMMTEALSAGHDFLSFVSNSWVVLLPLVMWLTVAVIGAIKRFTSKG